jgi:enoyl-CoA hydratase/carnithine racemase
MQMILTGDPIDAQTAFGYGLVQRVVPRERLYAEAEGLARKLLEQRQTVVRLAKRAVVEGIEMPLANGLALEARLVAQLAGS